MRLLYCSTIKYPSKLANRYQVYAMARALAIALGDNFYLGGRRIITDDPLLQNRTAIIKGSGFSFVIALRYLLFIRNHGIMHIYSRSERLFFFIVLFNNYLFHLPLKYIFEIHRLPQKTRFFHRYNFKKAHMLVVVTSFIKQGLIKIGIPEKKIFVAPDGVDLEPFLELRKKTKEELRRDLNLPPDKKIVCYVGTYKTMGMGKGVDELIIAFPEVLKKNPDAFLLLVGMDEQSKLEVEALIRQSGILEENGRVVAFVPQKVAQAYMVASDVLVMNFPWTEHYAYFMSPMKMFEYMASGTPIITTDLPSVREILSEKNAYFVKPGDPQGLARGISEVLSNQVLSDNISKQAFNDVSKYTWNVRAENILIAVKN